MPSVLLMGFMLTGNVLTSSVPWYGNVLSQALSTAFGVSALIYRFRLRGALASLLYAPIMFGFLLLFTLFLGALIFHDSL